MHTDFRIRSASSQDTVALAELGPLTFREAFGAFLPAEVIAARMAEAYDPKKVAADLANPKHTWFVADSEEGLVGFLSLGAGSAPSCIKTPFPLELQRLYVARKWHGCGPGSTLLLAGQKEAQVRGAERLWLLAWETNSRALNFYRKHGFEVAGTQNVELSGFVLPHLVLEKTL